MRLRICNRAVGFELAYGFYIPVHEVTHFFLAIGALAFASGAIANREYGHVHDHKPRHGGTVLEVNDLALEVVANLCRIQIYVREHGKPTDISRASAKVTLLADADRQQVELMPACGALEGTGSLKVSEGAKAMVVLSMPGRPVVSVRFALR